MQTPEGAAKARATIYAKYGEDYFKKIGADGGRNGNYGGFNAIPNLATTAGRKGGAISSRSQDKPPLEVRRAAYENKQEEPKKKTWSFKLARSN